ncbi:MAG: hypothetical protein H6704_24590 [Myxococcales bacterium]|nr:hypothetical protein [Myxococcales bacterium]
MRKVFTVSLVLLAVFAASAAWAGSAGQPPGGTEGGSGPEPEVLALILFSLVPGVFFARRALAANAEAEKV